MALRFRKSTSLTKGVKINFNKDSVSLTTGTKGAHFTVNSKGNTTTSVSIPGSGLSYTKRSSQRSTTNNNPTQLSENTDIDSVNPIVSGKNIKIHELNNKIRECRNQAILYLFFSFTVYPIIGLLCNVILSFFISIPYFVMPSLLCIAGLTIAAFKLISASDYKHQLKLYQMHCDKQQEKMIPKEKVADSKLLIPLSPQPSEDTSIKETNTTPKGTILTYELDQYFEEAGRFCIEKERVSIGLIQRFYKVGFNRAARILDELCDAGVISQEDGTKPRKICMTMEEFEDYLDRLHNYVLTH